ncbi:phage major capsid protein [bacterium]|nr:phage major capsid protein [bacterium]
MNERERRLREERARIVARMRELVDKADAEKRDLTADDQAEINKIEARIAVLTTEIELEQRLGKLEGEMHTPVGATPPGPDPGNNGTLQNRTRQQRVSEAIRRFNSGETELRTLAAVHAVVSRGEVLPAEFVEMQSDIFARMVLGEPVSDAEKRALQMDADVFGGFLVMPQQMIQNLIKAVDNEVFVRRYATKYTVPKAESLGVPVLETDMGDPTWTSELKTGNEDNGLSFGKRELHPHPLARLVKISNKLLRASFFNVEGLVIDRLKYKFSTVQENAFFNGSGTNEPLGVMVASPLGIPTSRDVSTDNEQTAITFDGLKEAKYALKSQYWAKARWTFHRDALKQIDKIKDKEDRYQWQPSTVVGQPDRLLNLPMDISEYMPNTFTSGQYVGLLSDWSFYWIADALDMEVQRLVELYATTNQTGLIGRGETDGMPVLSEAFVRVKLAS